MTAPLLGDDPDVRQQARIELGGDVVERDEELGRPVEHHRVGQGLHEPAELLGAVQPGGGDIGAKLVKRVDALVADQIVAGGERVQSLLQAHPHGQAAVQGLGVGDDHDEPATGSQPRGEVRQQRARVVDVLGDVQGEDRVEGLPGTKVSNIPSCTGARGARGRASEQRRPFEHLDRDTALAQQPSHQPDAVAELEHAPAPPPHGRSGRRSAPAGRPRRGGRRRRPGRGSSGGRTRRARRGQACSLRALRGRQPGDHLLVEGVGAGARAPPPTIARASSAMALAARRVTRRGGRCVEGRHRPARTGAAPAPRQQAGLRVRRGGGDGVLGGVVAQLDADHAARRALGVPAVAHARDRVVGIDDVARGAGPWEIGLRDVQPGDDRARTLGA